MLCYFRAKHTKTDTWPCNFLGDGPTDRVGLGVWDHSDKLSSACGSGESCRKTSKSKVGTWGQQSLIAPQGLAQAAPSSRTEEQDICLRSEPATHLHSAARLCYLRRQRHSYTISVLYLGHSVEHHTHCKPCTEMCVPWNHGRGWGLRGVGRPRVVKFQIIKKTLVSPSPQHSFPRRKDFPQEY